MGTPARLYMHMYPVPVPALPSAPCCPALSGPAARASACLPSYSMSGIYSAAQHVCLHPGGRHWQALLQRTVQKLPSPSQ